MAGELKICCWLLPPEYIEFTAAIGGGTTVAMAAASALPAEDMKLLEAKADGCKGIGKSGEGGSGPPSGVCIGRVEGNGLGRTPGGGSNNGAVGCGVPFEPPRGKVTLVGHAGAVAVSCIADFTPAGGTGMADGAVGRIPAGKKGMG